MTFVAMVASGLGMSGAAVGMGLAYGTMHVARGRVQRCIAGH